ncbi:MAG: MFS transporter [Proteobacteria bacterium]|nr:MFS transporter [Pseudomonadota bacterium]
MTSPADSPALTDYEEAPLRPIHLRVAFGASGGEFSDGFGLGIIGICLVRAAPQLGLGPVWLGLLGGASLVGLFFGSLFSGAAADRFGRRPIFAWNMAFLAVLSVLQALVHNRGELLLIRLAIGLVLGTDYAVNKPMLIEFTPRRARGKILGLLSVAWAAGYACAYAVGYALDGLGADAWRWMLLTSAVPCLLVLPFRLTTPESPLWLTRQGKPELAAAIVRRQLGAGIAPPVAVSQPPTAGGVCWQRLFLPQWRAHTLVGCAFFSCLVIPYFAVGTFISQVMSAMRLESAYVGGLIYNVTLLGGGIFGLLIIDSIPRRQFLVGSFTVAAIAMLLLITWPQIPAAAIIALFALFAGVLSAASILVYVYLPELFPTDLRASGIGLASATSRIGAAVSTFLLPVVVSTYGIRSALGACVVILALGAVLCQRWAPETKDLRLGTLDEVTDADPA